MSADSATVASLWPCRVLSVRSNACSVAGKAQGIAGMVMEKRTALVSRWAFPIRSAKSVEAAVMVGNSEVSSFLETLDVVASTFLWRCCARAEVLPTS